MLFPADVNTPEVKSDDTLILDVRTDAEFASGHVDGAINVPLGLITHMFNAIAPDKNREIVVYCASGARSSQAMRFLIDQGYANVSNGISAQQVAIKLNRAVRR